MKKVLSKIGDWIRGVFDAAFQKLKRHSGIAVDVTQAIKRIVVDNATTVDILTAIIPGTWDNGLVTILRRVIPEVAARVLISHNIIQATDDPETALPKLVEYLKTLPQEGQVDYWITISTRVAAALSDGRVTMAEIAGITQAIYWEKYVKPGLDV